jgi:lipopolysaccharide transport system ATP-binding protein
MSEPAIRVEHLGKRYRLGRQAGFPQATFREALMHRALAPLRWWRERADIDRAAAAATADEFWALRDVSFTINPGEVVGIIGRNGAGKSTLLKVLSRITEPTTGRVSVRGRVASLLEVGTGFHSELTGRENIFLNGAILGMTRAEILRRFDEIVAFAEVDRFLDTPVKRYSSGMYVRLAFAVAAHLEPEILIVDEVLAVGDAQFQKKCLGKMKSVAANSGRTVLFVSHNLSTITSMCERGVWLDRGQVKLIASAEQAVAAYLQQFTPESSLRLDLSEAPRDPCSQGKLRITEIELNHGQPLTNREPFSARLRFKTTARVEGVSLGIGFSTLDGTRVMSIDSDYRQERRDFPAGTEGTIELRLPYLALGPGTYSLDVGARSGEVSALDYMPGCGVLEVYAKSGVPAGFAMVGGGIRAEAEWQWNA